MEKILLVVLIIIALFNFFKASYLLTIFGRMQFMQKMSKSKDFMKEIAISKMAINGIFFVLLVIYLILAK